MAKPQWRDAAKEKFWRRMVRRWRHSGLTVRAFCEQHQLSEASFYGWRRVLARRDQETAPPGAAVSGAVLPAFVQVEVAAGRSVPGDSDAAAEGIEVVVRGRVVRLRRGFDAALLRQVLRVLEEPTC
jgi:hypothetical protein